MSNIQSEPEGSEPSYDYDELIKGITLNSIRRRLRYAPDLLSDDCITLIFYKDGI